MQKAAVRVGVKSKQVVSFRNQRLRHSYTPLPTRALCGDHVRAEFASRVRGVHEGLRGTLGVHVVHFPPMCLTARISLRRPTSHITPRTGPTRFDVRSSPGGRAEWALGEHPHVPRGRVAAWLGAGDGLGSFFFSGRSFRPELASTTLPRHARVRHGHDHTSAREHPSGTPRTWPGVRRVRGAAPGDFLTILRPF